MLTRLVLRLIFIVLLAVILISKFLINAQGIDNTIVGTWTLKGYQAMCEGDTLSITFQKQGLSYLNNNDSYLWKYECEWRLNGDTIYTKLIRCSFLDYQSPFKFEWLEGLEISSIIGGQDINYDQRQWWYDWFQKEEKWHPQYIINNNSLKLIRDSGEDDIVWQKSGEEEKVVTADIKNEIITAESLLETVLFKGGYEVNVVISDEKSSEKGVYDIHIATSYFVKKIKFMGFCGGSIAIVTRLVSFKTKYLFMYFNDQVWCVKTKYCRKAWDKDGNVDDEGLSECWDNLLRVQ